MVGNDTEFVTALDAELARLAALPPNWDGYGAPPINRAVIAAAARFIRALPESVICRPRVVPMSPGNLQFEWHRGKKVLELEFENPESIRYLQWDPDAGVEEEESFQATEIGKAVHLIEWFANGTCA